MEKQLIYFTLLLLAFLSCSSDNSSEIEHSPSIEDVIIKNGNSLLWKVEGTGIETSYLFGTMHMINEEYYHFPNTLSERISGVDAIIMEVDGIPNPFTTFQLMSLDSGSVHDYFSKEQLIDLLAFMDQELGISPQEFDQTYGAMKPFFILQTISQNYFDANAKSYDLTIMEIAGSNELPIIGLETIEGQLGFFDKVPKENMAEMILESVNDYGKEQKNTLKLMEYYAAQKVDKLIPLLQRQSPEFMEFEDVFLFNRNKAWVPKLENEMKDQSCFVAVGAGHLFGEGGLIDLLQKQGFTVTAISMD